MKNDQEFDEMIKEMKSLEEAIDISTAERNDMHDKCRRGLMLKNNSD